MKGDLARIPRYSDSSARFVVALLSVVLLVIFLFAGWKLFTESERFTGEMDDPCAEFSRGSSMSYPAWDLCRKQDARSPCPYPIILSEANLQKYTDCRVQQLSKRR